MPSLMIGPGSLASASASDSASEAECSVLGRVHGVHANRLRLQITGRQRNSRGPSRFIMNLSGSSSSESPAAGPPGRRSSSSWTRTQ
eukprot:2179120-Rhodomonas_salina.1